MKFNICSVGSALVDFTFSIDKEYEKEIKLLPQLITPGTDTIDVGVYRGVYSYELSRLSNHLHAFEANPII